MYRIAISAIALNLLLVLPVSAVRVSPKLDFGDSNPKPLSVGFRPDSEIRYLRDNGGTKTIYRSQPSKTDNIAVVCASGNCSATKSNTEHTNGISTDVLVHIKTNVDVSKIKNDTTSVPDVPIVIGSKSTTAPTYANNRPFGVSNSAVYQSNYPSVNLSPPDTVNYAFIPPNFAPSPQVPSDSLIRNYQGVDNYAPRFLGAENDIGVQSNYHFNANNNVNNNRPVGPRPAFYPKGVRGSNYNPVEFRKTYNGNNWSLVKWARNDISNNDRRIGSGIPRWTPCACQNPDVYQYPSQPTYPQHNQPSGINGKLTSLV